MLPAIADEGMWIPLLLGKYNYADMQKKGFKLTPEDIYSINKACLKDAIVIFGRGCTGELISDQGLLITNHHCGYGQVQNHSTVEHDYLTNGFWAMTQQEELTNPGLTVQFLVRMEDVTLKILEGITTEMEETVRQSIIKQNISKITKAALEGTHYTASIKPFYYGNEYYMFIYEEYKDVRLVGTPPSGIGKFGGDTDNWMWPRHTGDFSLFRIYANKNNEPAEYAPENVPYKPKKSLSISIKGVKKGDFTMVFGYPGRTSQYLTSYAVEHISQVENPQMINVREQILKIMGEDMNNSDKIRIQYASKYAGIANYWKKWLGEDKGLLKLNAIEKKKTLETKFQNWANSTIELKKKYGNLLPQFEQLYKDAAPYAIAKGYFNEAFLGIELMDISKYINENILSQLNNDPIKTIAGFKAYCKTFYRDYNINTDKRIFAAMLKLYKENVDKQFQPEILHDIEKKYLPADRQGKNDFTKYADYLYSKSILTDTVKLYKLLEKDIKTIRKKLTKDPSEILFSNFIVTYFNFYLKSLTFNSQLENLYRNYVSGLREMQQDRLFYPDANFTFRVTYGQVSDYEPRDGVYYNYYTTLDGIMAKDDPSIYDYRVPEKLKELYKKKDYGHYAENGTMKVAFTGSNHTTGGNSGSPVLNGNGELIGVNFDRNWEGTMSDIMYDPSQCRNIAIDIRYALFIIDKFAGAKHLINEMKIVE